MAFTGHAVLATDVLLPVLGRPGTDDVVLLGRGIAGLLELSLEVARGRRGAGAGRALVADALASVPVGEVVVAAVAPGNAASLRALLDD